MKCSTCKAVYKEQGFVEYNIKLIMYLLICVIGLEIAFYGVSYQNTENAVIKGVGIITLFIGIYFYSEHNKKAKVVWRKTK